MAGYNMPGYMQGNPQMQQAYQALLQAMNPMGQQPAMGQQQAAFQGDNRIFVNGPASALNIAMGVNAVTPPILDACNGVGFEALMRVLDEHMEALKVVQNREYTSLMERIRALRS